uniref:Uncharacterized protein n=1 Tax=Lepeophtheirus salmonis TaxID=72036 RepID=A0A0K2UVG5_LEPSM
MVLLGFNLNGHVVQEVFSYNVVVSSTSCFLGKALDALNEPPDLIDKIKRAIYNIRNHLTILMGGEMIFSQLLFCFHCGCLLTYYNQKYSV